MIVVTGATGKLGRLVIGALLEKRPAAQLVAAVRNPAKAANLTALGVQIRLADYDRPETLASAFRPGEKVLLISANEVGKRATQHRHAVDAAAAARVGLLAYTSLLRADTSTLALAEEHRMTEDAIRASGIPYVFLRNGWYVENHSEQIAGFLQHGAIAGAAGSGRFASAARHDYAEAAAAVLTSDGHQNAAYELAGEPFTLADFAAELSKQAGRRIVYTNLPPHEYKRVLVAAGLPGAYADVLVDSDLGASRGELDGSSADLRRLIGRPPTSLRDAIAAALKQPAAAR
jgi:NAD(P)H dehydrogenase (quinone)